MSSVFGNTSRSPYTEDDEAYTIRLTFASFAALRIFSVPTTLTSFEVNGSFTDLGTEGNAA